MENHKTKLVATACVILLFFTFYLLNKNKKDSHIQDTLSKSISEIQVKEDFFLNNFEIGSAMDGLYIQDISYIENNHEKKITGLVHEKPVLLCIYKIECSACEKSELKELQNIFKDVPGSAYILCSHLIKRDLYIYAKKNQVEIPIWGIQPDTLGWIAENFNKTYYFILHPNLKISHVYFPSKDYPELNQQYLEGVRRFLTE